MKTKGEREKRRERRRKERKKEKKEGQHKKVVRYRERNLLLGTRRER